MRGDALQQGQRVAYAVGLVGRQCGRRYRGVYVDDLLEQGAGGPEAVPQHGCQVGLALLAQLQQSGLTGVRVGQLVDPLVDLAQNGISTCHGRSARPLTFSCSLCCCCWGFMSGLGCALIATFVFRRSLRGSGSSLFAARSVN